MPDLSPVHMLNDIVTLYLQDCLSVLKSVPTRKVALVVTSPPYNLVTKWTGGGPRSNRKAFHKKLANDWYPDEREEDTYQEWQKEILRECRRVCAGSIFYVHKVRYALKRYGKTFHPMNWLAEFPIWQEIIWDRGGSQASNTRRWGNADERIYMIGRPLRWHNPLGSNIWRIRPETLNLHPCPFPVELATRCITATTDPGDLVCDPFMGIGSTGVACINTGRQFVGMEIDRTYFDVACERLRMAHSQLSILDPGTTYVNRSLLESPHA